jgi:hypothetical protein
MNLWNFKNETKVYWQIKWGEKEKGKWAGARWAWPVSAQEQLRSAGAAI